MTSVWSPVSTVNSKDPTGGFHKDKIFRLKIQISVTDPMTIRNALPEFYAI